MSESSIKRLLVTGALGHIGSRFIHDIVPGDFEQVILMDNLLTQRYCSLFNLPQGVSFEFVEADVCTARLEPYLERVDAVLHLAAITNAAASFDNEEEVERVNFMGTERLAKACSATGCRLLFLSTTSVYGVSEGLVDENCSAEQLQPQSPYARSKLRAERLLQELGQDESLKFVICRFGTIYGFSIGMRFHTAVNKFIWQACLGEPLTVWRSALHQQRPYLELGDAIRALRFILCTGLFDNRVYNVLTDNKTVAEIIEAIRRYVPDVQLQEVESRIMNQLSYTVSNESFHGLGFDFTGDLDVGVRETLTILSGVRHGRSLD